MPEVRRIYRVNSPDLGELNRVLADLADRMDQLEGYRGKGDFKTIPSSTQGASSNTDLARYGDVITYADSVTGQPTATLKIYAGDSPTTILHGMGSLI
jgi:hypothetical protein